MAFYLVETIGILTSDKKNALNCCSDHPVETFLW